MKQLLFLPAIALATAGLPPCTLSAQNYFAVDKLALNTPPSKSASVRTLAEYLCAEQPDEAHKIRAIYAWVSLNIAYVDSTDERELWATPQHLERQSPARVLQNGTAVCQGYANLFCALATEAGLACEVVTGLVKNAEGEVEQIGHAWAVARINGDWKIFDPTWGVPPPGMTRWKVTEKYFMADPKQFVLRHLPDDPVWQLVDHPISERRFRNDSDADILAFLNEDNEELFNFRDTLTHWISMNPSGRKFASENRVLQFNGSNERVVFGLGQSYWGLFFELRGVLDSLTDEAILADTLQIDTTWFETQINLLERYHARARMLFDRLETPERVEKTEKFYTPKDVAALIEKTRGDMRTGVFENLLHTMQEEVLSENQIARLRYQAALARKYFETAGRTMDCGKLAGSCFEISHNRSLMDIQLAQRLVRQAQDLANDQTAAKNIKSIGRNLREAQVLFLQAMEDCEQMRLKPPKFAFVEERIVSAKQGLLTLRACEIRADRTSLTPEIEAVLVAAVFPARKAERLEEKMTDIGRDIDHFGDTLSAMKRDLGAEYIQMARFNLDLENYTLQYNLANLRFRIALNNYETAVNKNNFPAQREHIRADANRALLSMKMATTALDSMEDSGRLKASSISQKQLQINKLSKALRDFMAGL